MDASLDRTARLAGMLYLALLPFGIFSFVYVPSVILVPGDALATASGVLASERLFRAGIASHLASQILVVFLAMTMFRLLSGVNRNRAALMVCLALLCVSISFAAELNSLAALDALRAGPGGSTPVERVAGQVALLLEGQRSGVFLAQVFWALWMVPLAGLVFRSGFLPRALAIPALIASAGYLADSALHVLSPGAPMVGPYTAVAELVLPLWLVVRGAPPRQRPLGAAAA